ncbi:MAG: GNAT family N-acetyltransferase, partial [Pseudomonadota bacterium]|nr:GNAT family N-acetyltransferase [Pseudomonadota bacterium]
AMLLGQLAVDHRYQGRQCARSLIVHSFRTVVRLSMETGCYCLLTAPLDDEVRTFYRHFDFRDLPFDKGRRMFVRIAELARNGFAPT